MVADKRHAGKAFFLFVLLSVARALAQPQPNSLPPAPLLDASRTEIEKMGCKFLAFGAKASWSPDGKWVVFGRLPFGSGLRIIEVQTGALSDLVSTGKDPDWSPGNGRWIVYVRGTDPNEEVWLIESNGKGDRKIADGGFPHFAADEKRVFFHSRREGKVQVIDVTDQNSRPVEVVPLKNSYYPAVSSDGKCVAFVDGIGVQVMDCRTGKTVARAYLPSWQGGLPSWSVDGRYVAYGSYAVNDNRGLWVLDLETQRMRRVVPGCSTMLAWSKDGRRAAFDVRTGAKPGVWIVDAALLNLRKPETSGRIAPAAVRHSRNRQ